MVCGFRQGLVALRKKQTSTNIRARLAVRFGWTNDTEEFKRRVTGLAVLARTSDSAARRTRSKVSRVDSMLVESAEGNLDWRDLQEAIARFVDLKIEEVDENEVSGSDKCVVLSRERGGEAGGREVCVLVAQCIRV